MSDELVKALHPGAFIRENVLPPDMSVKEAAKRLGVGRPALSNMLNGNSSLSPVMAVRLEKAFGVEQQKLIDLQAAFDRQGRRGEGKMIAVQAYVPAFLSIRAGQIHNWADNLDARRLLPVLLRKLVHSTGLELRQVDFPGYDNAERKGADGLIEAGAATPWIPEGMSHWEFGTNQNPGAKAEGDYKARLVSIPPAERAGCTFVFVTPRNWHRKTEWARTKNVASDWKAVRAFDASDLEQWLEQSIPAQIWLAEHLSIPVSGFKTLDQCWERWAEASDPQITPRIFEPSIATHRATLKAWLEKQSERPFVVAADSKDEALAFLACLFQDPAIGLQSRDLAAVFESARTLRTLAGATSPFIPIVCTDEAERELASVYRRLHSITLRPRNAIDSKPDIALDLLDNDSFKKALAVMGIEGDRAEQLARASGRSPTILRRRLSRIDAIKTPQWAGDADIARKLISITLVGAWHANTNADCEVVGVLADKPYQEVEEGIAHLLQFDDCPIWSVGQYRGIASKIDALFAINKMVTKRDITDFFDLAEYVLSETDPALDLPEDQRWAAGLYGKVRNHSAALRESICETLVILAVHGNNLFSPRLGIDVEGFVSKLIQQLLTPLTFEKLLSHQKDLPSYAEAAPDAFLKLVEADLQQSQPVVLGLLKPVESGVFGGCPRSGLLWALECLAWKNLGRASVILAQLSRTVIEDNWVNKPIASLSAIFRSWMPQTAASVEDRAKALELLTRRFPDIGWQICIEQFESGSQSGQHSYRPRWRGDASGAGQWATRKEVNDFGLRALELAFAWPKHDQKTLGDLVERLHGMPEEDEGALWDLIEAWADREINDKAKAELRERIRRFVFTRHGPWKRRTRDRARAAYAKLEVRDVVDRHAWLFATQWVPQSIDDLEDKTFDWRKGDETTHKLRAAAINEIWEGRGYEGAKALLYGSETPHTVGRYLGLSITDSKTRESFLRECLFTFSDKKREVDACIQGFLRSLDDKARSKVLTTVAKSADAEQLVRLFQCAPFGENTWRLLDQYSGQIRDRYWHGVLPYWNGQSEAELNELVDRLLEANRPRAAFNTVHMDWPQIETSRLKRLLIAVATSREEPAGHYQLRTYDISAALKSLDGRRGVSPDEMAQLEFLFLETLDHSEHGIPNLERQVAESPFVFVQALALAYRRNDMSEDPVEWQIEDPARRAVVAAAAHRLLDQARRVPGTDPDGKVNADLLLKWVTEVRRMCGEHGRTEIGDQKIGELLSRAPVEEDGAWPCESVCEVMERVASEHIGIGFRVGVYNARGMHRRGEGGAQERDLAAAYQAQANRRAFSYPHVYSVLEGIADNYERDGQLLDQETKVRKRLWD